MGKKTLLHKVSIDQFIAVAAASISVLFLLAFGSQIVEIYRLRSALSLAEKGVEGLQAEQAALEATLAYVKTDDYAEEVARAELNKVRPGDHRVVIVTRAAPAATPVPTPVPPAGPAEASYVDSWWNLLFGD